jgi:transposase
MLMPVDMREWLPEDSMVYFVVDAVEQLDVSGFSVNMRGSGSEQYPPAMMLALLIYCYTTGRFSSRAIEAATYSDVAVRYICGGDKHPDHDTICSFRMRNRNAFKDAFVKMLLLAQELGYLKKIGGVSVDGTKLKANASKHGAVTYKRAGEMIQQLEEEIEELTVMAETADSAPLEDGLTVPGEIALRSKRKARLAEARNVMESRYEEVRREKQRIYDESMRRREEIKSCGKKPRGREPVAPPAETPGKSQYNFTDPESRIMRTGDHFDQTYNAQAVVDTEGSMLILGAYVTTRGIDKEELAPALESVTAAVREISDVCADTGYFSEQAVTTIERDGKGPRVYCAVGRQSHHRRVEDILKKVDQPEPSDPPASITEAMRRRLKTCEGRTKYKKRKETVEPVFGIIKSVMGFRQFLTRGLEQVSIEWDLVVSAYNMKRLYRLSLPT